VIKSLNPTRKRGHAGLAKRYVAGLRAHVSAKKASNGDCAQGLGRTAAQSGLAPSDLALMHKAALIEVAATPEFLSSGTRSLTRASFFFAQALVPLEAVQQATRDTNRRLQQRNEALRLHTAALARVNRSLEAEVSRRKAQEAIVHDGKKRYHRLFLESQRMEMKLRQVTRQILAAQEAERKEISRELHDEVVQTLIGINVQLSALCKGTTDGLHTIRAKIVKTQRLVEDSVTAVHRFARGLRPAVLDDLGLIPALHAYCKARAAQKKLKIQLTAFAAVEQLDSEGRTVLYRVAQEALTNVCRHAEASAVTVVISDQQSMVRLEIQDDGKSFSVEKKLFGLKNKRLGLVGMKERIEMVGGSLVIVSTPGKGTMVRAEIPFTRDNTKK
jgi:signal transduction histidine kinase